MPRGKRRPRHSNSVRAHVVMKFVTAGWPALAVLHASRLLALVGRMVAFFPIAGVAALTGVLGTLLLIQAGLLTATAFRLKRHL